MVEIAVTRRAMGMALGAACAWAASPVRRAMAAAAVLPRPDFIAPLIARMTLEEKAGQLSLMAAAWAGGAANRLNPPGRGSTFETQVEDGVQGRLTGVFNGAGVVMAKHMQDAVMQRSRLKIPLIFAADVIHGYRTIFPVPLAEASSFDPELARRTARAAAFEASGAGLDWTFFPMVDLVRDERWGRVMEGAGEDVLLGKLFAAARVRGLQGDDLKADTSLMACVKHFAAYGAVEAGLEYNSADMSEPTLEGVYLPTYRAGVDAGALSVLTAFNDVNGVPSTANKALIEGVLRRRWGFQGIVVSDYTSDEEMVAAGYAADRRDAARLAFLAGVDISMQSGVYQEFLPGLVRAGEVTGAAVDLSVGRVLAIKAALGLFDDPYRRIDVRREEQRVRQPAALALAREAGRKAAVLLKNEGDLLPLPRSGRRIALIGPFAAGQHDLDGPWVVYGDQDRAVDLLAGVRAALSDPSLVTATAGSGVEAPLPGGLEAAVAAARAADVVVLAIGESETMAGESQSRTEIVVPAPQMALAEAVAATGKPVVVVLKNGRALALQGAVRDAPAILVTWFLGSETGNAIADILFGAEGPSGRLPISFPVESGQEPYYYDHKITGRPALPGPHQPYKSQYRETRNQALYPFGHGLTYGRIAYSELALSAPVLPWSGAIEARARISNTGARAAEEVVQLYVHDRRDSLTRPIRELKAFRKLSLAAGASTTVSFTLTRPMLEFIGLDLQPTVEAGVFDLWIAPSAEAQGVQGSFTLAAA